VELVATIEPGPQEVEEADDRPEHERMAWFNRGDDPEFLKEVEAQSGTEVPGQEESPEVAEESRRLATCSHPGARMKRFKSMDVMSGAKTFNQGEDPLFPASMSSIASGSDNNCGDSAAGISKTCSGYNHWGNMKDWSSAKGRAFSVFDPKTGMPSSDDIAQGELGTCYMLAALLSISYRRPKVIQDMFVRTHLWSQGIVTTKWLINGRESFVEVDLTLPGKNGRPFFSQPGPASGAWWVPILEKTWSKIYTSFKAAESGHWSNAAAAITRAPTTSLYHGNSARGTKSWSSTQTEVWNQLVEGTNNAWPMGASTSKNAPLGLASRHAYAVLRAYHSSTYGNVVECRNPYHRDRYKGSIPNTNLYDGKFTMTIAEYFQAFSSSEVAKVRENYHVSSTELASSSGLKAAYTFSTTSDKPIYVSVVWPGSRIVEPCKALDPKTVVSVRKSGKNFSPTSAHGSGGNAAVVEILPTAGGGAGTYQVVVSVDFPSDPSYIKGVYMNIYSSQGITIHNSKYSYDLLSLGMVGPNIGGAPCDYAFVPGKGMWQQDSSKIMGGVATYWTLDKSEFMYYVSGDNLWYLIGKSHWSDVEGGNFWSHSKVKASHMSCECRDSGTGVSGFSGVGCNNVGYPSYKWSNVRCDTQVQYTALAQASCPRTCKIPLCEKAATAYPGGLPAESAPAPAPTPPVSPPVPAPPPATPAPPPPPPPPAPPAPPAGCTCPTQYPACYKPNGFCYISAASNSYTSTCARECTKDAAPAPPPAPTRRRRSRRRATAKEVEACTCDADTPYCYKPNKWCYKSASSNTYSHKCQASCTSSYQAPATPPPPPGCTCSADHPYCYSGNKWCYASAISNKYSQTCAGKCTASIQSWR